MGDAPVVADDGDVAGLLLPARDFHVRCGLESEAPGWYDDKENESEDFARSKPHGDPATLSQVAVVNPLDIADMNRSGRIVRPVILDTLTISHREPDLPFPFRRSNLMFHRCAILFVALCAVLPLTGASDPRSTNLSTPPHSLGEHNEVLNGVRLYYRMAGKSIDLAGRPSTPVIFLHGGPGYNSHSFATLAGPRLEQHLQMVYFDQRGCGRSERPWTQAYSIETLVEDIEALRHRLGADKISLIGHSFGGALALEYAVRHPEHVWRMVLVGGFSDGPAWVRVGVSDSKALIP